MRQFVLCLASCLLLLPINRDLHAGEVADDIATIAAVGPNGKGAVAARQSRDRLAKRGREILPKLLDAMDTSNVIAANWIRTIVDDVIATELKKPQPNLPVSLFEKIARDRKRAGRLRRYSVDWVERLKPGFRDKLISTLLNDPEFRDEAITMTLARGDAAKQAGDVDAAVVAYELAFRSARNSGQIASAATKLGSVGKTVSIVEQMGFVTDWYLLGPFDAPGMSGFETSFPPEKKVDLNETFKGKTGDTIRWTRHQSDDRFGQLNLIRSIASVKEAVGYAYTELDSDKNQDVELRCGADDNLTVWINGKVTFRRLQWLNGTRLDRFTAKATLKKGRNRVLVKICQGPQHKNPAVPNNWSLQVRFCDAAGLGIRLQPGLPKVTAKE
jgi:hypothetical protein